MASDARIASWKRYDDKRKGRGERLRKERHRGVVRRSKLSKIGWCCSCLKWNPPTVFHHVSYDDPMNVIEVCYKCHRKLHPRKLFKSKKIG